VLDARQIQVLWVVTPIGRVVDFQRQYSNLKCLLLTALYKSTYPAQPQKCSPSEIGQVNLQSTKEFIPHNQSHSTFSPKTEHNGYLVSPSEAIPITQHTTLAIMELFQSAKYTYALFQI
jgi:hypothetical protein